MNKKDGGKSYGSYGWYNEKKQNLLKKRYHILKQMQKKVFASSMTIPIVGPDFGGDTKGGQFMPAIKRYNEGSFVRGLIASNIKLSEWKKKNRIYFISGLYGLVHYKEPIQNYDLDLRQSILQEIWRKDNVLTEYLLQELKKIRTECNVINCCADVTYSSLLNWDEINKSDHIVRHVVAQGDFTGRQVRWSCGHLAGDTTTTIKDLMDYQECQYTSDNGSIRFLKAFPEIIEGIPVVEKGQLASIAVAIFSQSQQDAFMRHAHKQGWNKFLKFEFIWNLRQETINKLNNHRIKLLIIHVDDKHARIQKYYQTKSHNIVNDIPSDWEYQKIKNKNYSQVQLECKVSFKR